MVRRVLSVVCVLLLVPVAQVSAQGRSSRGPDSGRGGPGGFSRSSPTMLLGQESVQKDLQLTPQQVQALTTISEQQRTAMTQAFQLDREERGARIQEISKTAEASIGQVLSPEQQQRLTQINLQQQGTRVLEQPEVAQQLNLTTEQLAQIKQIQEASSEEVSALFRKQMEEIRKAAEKKVTSVFTPEQLAKWNEARGEPFTGEIVFPRFGGGPPRGTSPGEQATNSSTGTPKTDSISGPNGKPAANTKAPAKTTAPKKTTTPPKKTTTPKKTPEKSAD